MKKTGMVLDAYSMSELKVLAKKAEEAGFHSIWATELYRSSFQQLAAASAVTKKIFLGSAVSLAFARSPLITALSVLDLDEVSKGRLILGLGSGAKRTNENFHGVEHGKPVKHITECIDIVRSILKDSHVHKDIQFNGEYYRIDMKGYTRPFKPFRDDIPIYLAGIGNNMTRASGMHADGYIGHVVCSERYLRELIIPAINHGLELSGRNRNDFNVSSIITCAVSDDIEKAKRAAKATIAFYALVKTYEPPFRLHGFLEQTKQIRAAYFKKDIEAMISHVNDDMLNTFSVVGDSEYCIERIERYRELVDLPILSVPHYFIDFDEIEYYQDNLLEVFGNTR